MFKLHLVFLRKRSEEDSPLKIWIRMQMNFMLNINQNIALGSSSLLLQVGAASATM